MTTVFPTRRGLVRAVDGMDFVLHEGEKLGIVGESGSGKSVTLLSIMGLVPHPGEIVDGDILLQGDSLLRRSAADMRRMRGKDIALIFQDPLTTLNPVFPVGEQIRESLRIHNVVSAARRRGRRDFWAAAARRPKKERVIQVMEDVGIPSPMERGKAYPHQFSGGMQQRAIIAIALSCEPRLLLADEPTTALDVTIQAQIMDLLNKINRERGTSIILVTHNLGLVAEFCQTSHRHVCRLGDGTGYHRRGDRRSQAPLHGGTAALLAPHFGKAGKDPPYPRPRARPGQPAARLSLFASLRAGHAQMPGGPGPYPRRNWMADAWSAVFSIEPSFGIRKA